MAASIALGCGDKGLAGHETLAAAAQGLLTRFIVVTANADY